MDRDDVVDELRSIKDDETWQVSQSDGNFETAKQRMMGIYEAVNAFGWKSKGNKKWLRYFGADHSNLSTDLS